MASQGKEGQGRQKALPVPAHGKASPSAPLIIGSSFSLLGPPRRRGALPGVHFARCCCSLSPENSLWRHSGLNFQVEGWGRGSKFPPRGLSSSPEHLWARRRRAGWRRGSSTGYPRAGGGKREAKSLPATLRGHVYLPAPLPKFPSTSGKEPGMPPACAAPAAFPQPCAPHRGVGAAVSLSLRCRRDGTGRVSYLPAWHRVYVSMALGGAGPEPGAGPGAGAGPAGRPRRAGWGR